MSRDEENKHYGCFRCGEIEGSVHKHDVNGMYVCDVCGEHGVIAFHQVLDIINGLWIDGEISIEPESFEGYIYD